MFTCQSINNHSQFQNFFSMFFLCYNFFRQQPLVKGDIQVNSCQFVQDSKSIKTTQNIFGRALLNCFIRLQSSAVELVVCLDEGNSQVFLVSCGLIFGITKFNQGSVHLKAFECLWDCKKKTNLIRQPL